MKTTATIIAAVACLGALPLKNVLADKKDHDHEHEHGHKREELGPKGGRLIYSVEPHAEFFVEKDRKVRITFVDDDNRVVALGDKSVSITCGDRRNPTRLSFVKSGESLLSTGGLPKGDNIPLVLQIRLDAKSKSVLEKFNVDLSECPECDSKEYACICDHHDHDHDHEHDHKHDKDGEKHHEHGDKDKESKHHHGDGDKD